MRVSSRAARPPEKFREGGLYDAGANAGAARPPSGLPGAAATRREAAARPTEWHPGFASVFGVAHVAPGRAAAYEPRRRSRPRRPRARFAWRCRRALGVEAFAEALGTPNVEDAGHVTFVVRTPLLVARDLAALAVGLLVRADALGPVWRALGDALCGSAAPRGLPPAAEMSLARGFELGTRVAPRAAISREKATVGYALLQTDLGGWLPDGRYLLADVQRAAHRLHGDAAGAARASATVELRRAAIAARKQALGAAMATRGYVWEDLDLGFVPIAHEINDYNSEGKPPLEAVLAMVKRRHEAYTSIESVLRDGAFGAVDPKDRNLRPNELFDPYVIDGEAGLDVLVPRFERICKLARALAAPDRFESYFVGYVFNSSYSCCDVEDVHHISCWRIPLARAYVEEGGGEAAMAAAVASVREALGVGVAHGV